jgi:hypothetical protein
MKPDELEAANRSRLEAWIGKLTRENALACFILGLHQDGTVFMCSHRELLRNEKLAEMLREAAALIDPGRQMILTRKMADVLTSILWLATTISQATPNVPNLNDAIQWIIDSLGLRQQFQEHSVRLNDIMAKHRAAPDN